MLRRVARFHIHALRCCGELLSTRQPPSLRPAARHLLDQHPGTALHSAMVVSAPVDDGLHGSCTSGAGRSRAKPGPSHSHALEATAPPPRPLASRLPACAPRRGSCALDIDRPELWSERRRPATPPYLRRRQCLRYGGRWPSRRPKPSPDGAGARRCQP